MVDKPPSILVAKGFLTVFSAKLSSGEKDQNFLIIVSFLVAERKKLVTFAALLVAVSNLAANN